MLLVLPRGEKQEDETVCRCMVVYARKVAQLRNGRRVIPYEWLLKWGTNGMEDKSRYGMAPSMGNRMGVKRFMMTYHVGACIGLW
ncbi:hypothetical protein AALP_AA1G157200 [Arabis alpina]|uniref:Uncharacterized protein n=1 Tax=Arabis alpina TaxID=50452 RepID=A0A087HNG4_ARAAL|nr:hypothetical protein AALP_AA1G157200 [Arabis alpina]